MARLPLWLRCWTAGLFWTSMGVASPSGQPAAGSSASGVVAEAVLAESAAALAGLEAGDVLLSWSRAGTPANPEAHGTIDSPFDVAYLWTEELPRGAVAVAGRRGPEAMSWILPGGKPPGLSVRPDLAADLQALYQEGKGLVESKKVVEGAERFRSGASQARQAGGRLVAVWLLSRAAEVLAGARMWQEADAAYEEAVGEAEGHLTPLIAAQLHRAWAFTYYSREDLVSVAAHGRRALALEEAQAPVSLRVASSLNIVSATALHRMELAAAEEALRRALGIVETCVPGTIMQANLLHNLATVLQLRGELSSAEDYYRRALTIRERVIPGSDLIAASFVNLGKLALVRGDLTKAEEYLRRSLAINEKSNPDSLDVANGLEGLGGAAKKRGDLAAAEDYYRRALALEERLVPGSLSVSATLHLLGDVAREGGRLDVAEDHYRRALAIVQKVYRGSSDEAETLHALGLIQRRKGRLAEAAAFLLQALDALESQRARVGGDEEGRAGFFVQYAPYYHESMEVLVEQGRSAEALHVLERSRARSLLTLFAERDVVFSSALPPELARERRRSDADYDRVQASLAELDVTRDSAQIDEILGRLRDLRTVQEDIATRIRKASPRFASVQYPQPLDLSGIRAALDPGTVFLAYSVGRERTLLFAVESASAQGPGLYVFSLPVGEHALREKVAAFRQQVQRPSDSGRGVLTARAAELYELLLRPAESRLAASERLLVSPDGPLHALPLGALVRTQGQAASFLIEWKPLLVVGSATVHAELKKARRPGASGAGRLVAFGDPRYPALAEGTAAGVRDAEVRSVVGGGFGLAPLPSSRSEVEGIAALFPGRAQKYLGEEATEGRAKSVGSEARYLHFACHATLDERFPLNSAVALTIRDKPGEGEDNGLLQAWEIFDRVRIEADLVTLSACNTALGAEMGGEGLLGLRRAFHYAGARSVLASLWAVSDRSTAILMKRFYGHLEDGLSLDRALRAAQLDLIHTRGLSHPYRWAAFQLSGDWR